MLDWFLYYSVELANTLSEGNSVMLITRDHNYEISSPENPISVDEFLDEFVNRKVKREKLHYRRGNYKSLFEVVRLFKKVRLFNPEVIHVQENTDWRILLLVILLGFKKVVLTVHDITRHPGEKESFFLHYIRMRFRRCARRVIVHGKVLKDQLISEVPPLSQRVFVVPIGVLLSQKWRNQANEKEELYTILIFGRMNNYKGLDILIKAEPIISRVIPNIKIIIAGRGEDIDRYEETLNANKSFEVHNRFISDLEVANLFCRASVVVLPYVEASQSGVIPIAYYFGKPVVATNVGSISEVVDDGKTGLIVASQNPEQLGEALIKLLREHELRKAMGRNAYQKAHEELSWENIAKKTLEIYSGIL